MLCKKTLKVLALSLSFSLALAGSAAALQPQNEFAASTVQQIQKGTGSFKISDLNTFMQVRTDVNHFFQRGYQFSYQKDRSGGYIIRYVPNPKTAVSQEEAAQLQSYVEPMVQKVAKMSAKDQLWYVYEKLSDETTYDYKLQNPNRNKAIACLRDHQSVCEGYTLAFREVCNRLNIPNIVVYSDGDANREGHCWNQVYLDGQWKNVDVTFSSTSKNKQAWFLSDTHMYDDCTDQEWVQLTRSLAYPDLKK